MRRFLKTRASILGGLCLWAASIPATARAQALVNRPLEVRRTDAGFILVGYRAEVGSQDRFTLVPDMSSDQARAQLNSIQWDQIVDKLEDEGAAAAARRLWNGDIERVFVGLPRPGGSVSEVAYEKIPARYSRDNLVRLIRASYGPKIVVAIDEGEHFNYRFVSANSTLVVDAQRLEPGTPAWRVRYHIVDLTPMPAEDDEPEPRDLTAVEPKWPLPDLMQALPTTQPAPGEILIPQDIGKGLKQVYPPTDSRPAEP
ncbi:MAG: hypothetical protein JSU68_12000 [Phycisphaerales bacterium]|nr:MAG: hypothetical protein JSU68_12000 [Phycisphaerales bacterium]